jgi:hypothetical protein
MLTSDPICEIHDLLRVAVLGAFSLLLAYKLRDFFDSFFLYWIPMDPSSRSVLSNFIYVLFILCILILVTYGWVTTMS